MGTLREVTISAARREFTLVGRHPLYLRGLVGFRAEDSELLPGAISDLPAGSTLLDVGANIGLITLSLAALRPDCRVVAFEPLPSNLDCLKENVAASGLTNIEIVAAAVSDQSGSVALTDNGPWSVAGIDSSAVACRAMCLDEIDTPSIAFLKIDVEGFEPNVLAGAARILARRPLVLMEFNTWTLLLHHYDPLAFAAALLAHCDVLAMIGGPTKSELPLDPIGLVHRNLIDHHSVSDVLLRPRSSFPDLATMTQAPAATELRRLIATMQASRSWRMTAPLRALNAALKRRK